MVANSTSATKAVQATSSASGHPNTRAVRSANRLGRTIPGVLAVWFLIDMGSRFLPLTWLNLYPFQIASQLPGRYSPFTPNFGLLTRDYPGELALAGNLPRTERRSPLMFRTDALGFRVTPGADTAKPLSVLLMEGDSYTFGAALG
jgi:hypothetical protein